MDRNILIIIQGILYLLISLNTINNLKDFKIMMADVFFFTSCTYYMQLYHFFYIVYKLNAINACR